MTKKGDRVELVSINDVYTRLSPGARGTVALIDSLGTVHVRWDSGAYLGLVEEDGDRWRVIEEEPVVRPKGWPNYPEEVKP